MEIYNDNGRFISILSDYGFKATFGNEANTTFLKKALQALINAPIPIKSVEFVKNEISAITIDSRSGIYDILRLCWSFLQQILRQQKSNFQKLSLTV
ncbi:MAG: PD-(D/E)XK nuclease family transposase [Bacteroidota bacterium]